MARAKIAEGNRVHFWCPGCDGAHWIVEAPDGWTFNGDLERPTFTPSLLIRTLLPRDPVAIACHSFVTDGRIQFLSASTHALAGQTVDLPEWPYSQEN